MTNNLPDLDLFGKLHALLDEYGPVDFGTELHAVIEEWSAEFIDGHTDADAIGFAEHVAELADELNFNITMAMDRVQPTEVSNLDNEDWSES